MRLSVGRNSIRDNTLRQIVRFVACDFSHAAVLGPPTGDLATPGLNCRRNRDIHQSRHKKKPMQRSGKKVSGGFRGMSRVQQFTSLLARLACFTMLFQPMVIANCPMHGRRAAASSITSGCNCRQRDCCQRRDSVRRGSDVTSMPQISCASNPPPTSNDDIPVCSCQRPIEHTLPASYLRLITNALAFQSPEVVASRSAACELLHESQGPPTAWTSSGRYCFLSCRIQV